MMGCPWARISRVVAVCSVMRQDLLARVKHSRAVKGAPRAESRPQSAIASRLLHPASSAVEESPRTDLSRWRVPRSWWGSGTAAKYSTRAGTGQA